MEVTRKQSKRNFPKNEHFLPPLIRIRTCAYQWVRHVCPKLGLLCFLVTFVLRFALLSYSCLLTYVRLLTLTHTYVFLRIRTCAYQWVRRSFFFFFFFRKIWFALFSCYFRFKIRPFVLLLSSYG